MQITLSFPSSDAGLLAWSQNVIALITPVPATYGLVTLDVTNYTALNVLYATSLAACDPGQRSKSAVVAKNQAKLNLKNGATLLANKIYADAAVTDAMKVELGMPPRATPQQIPVPRTAPVIDFLSSNGSSLFIRLRAGAGAGRGKPAGCSGASLFTAVAPTAPGDISGWMFQGNVGKVNKINVPFPSTIPAGSKIWITAFWFNGRKESGPAATPLGVNLPGGGALITTMSA